ncbi:hypothetical protein lerEdw1_011539 [Lerista edwardsae]|nr:hypothetical protein lerEdw1_011539 [Lerista edwardsae]
MNQTAEQDQGGASNPSQNPAPSWVNGMQGQKVLLQISISSSGDVVNKIEWKFHPKNSRSLTVVESQGGKTLRLNPSDRFGERLEAVNETTLLIKDLELEDAGLYEAQVRRSSAENEEYTFNLTVHKPVPELQIRPRLASHTPAGCDVTLQCQAAGPGEFAISWRGGNPLQCLEGSADWYQLSGNGTDLHLFWEPNPLDSKFTCQASNAVDQKEASFDLLSICSDEDLQGPFVSVVAAEIKAGRQAVFKGLFLLAGNHRYPWDIGPRSEELHEDRGVYAQLSMPWQSSEQVT